MDVENLKHIAIQPEHACFARYLSFVDVFLKTDQLLHVETVALLERGTEPPS
jgi:hypothetical protein